jgi:hypothetical protein
VKGRISELGSMFKAFSLRTLFGHCSLSAWTMDCRSVPYNPGIARGETGKTLVTRVLPQLSLDLGHCLVERGALRFFRG